SAKRLAGIVAGLAKARKTVELSITLHYAAQAFFDTLLRSINKLRHRGCGDCCTDQSHTANAHSNYMSQIHPSTTPSTTQESRFTHSPNDADSESIMKKRAFLPATVLVMLL